MEAGKFRMLRIESMGDCLIMDDRWLHDFSKAWGGLPAEPSRQLVEETNAYFQKQKKQTAVSTSVGDGNLRVVDDSNSNVIQIWSTEGAISVQRSDVDELIRVLSAASSGSLQALATGTPDVSQRSAPGQNELAAKEARPNHPGFVSQAEKNEIAMKKALGLS